MDPSGMRTCISIFCGRVSWAIRKTVTSMPSKARTSLAEMYPPWTNSRSDTHAGNGCPRAVSSREKIFMADISLGASLKAGCLCCQCSMRTTKMVMAAARAEARTTAKLRNFICTPKLAHMARLPKRSLITPKIKVLRKMMTPRACQPTVSSCLT